MESVRDSSARTEGSTSPPRLELRGISKRFEAVVALRDVSFAIAPGELHALVGENGAGKSTLVGIITGLRQADSGGRTCRWRAGQLP